MTRTIAWVGLSASLLWLACRSNTIRTTADAAAGADGTANGGAGMAGSVSGTTGPAGGAGGGAEASGGANSPASGGAGGADGAGSGATGGAANGGTGGAAGMTGAGAGARGASQAGAGGPAGGGAGGRANGGAAAGGGGASGGAGGAGGTSGGAADAASGLEASQGFEAGGNGPADGGEGREDGGASDTLAGRDAKPLTVTEATALYQDSVNNPGTVYSLEELQVPGAWDALGIQLFSVGFGDQFGYVINLGPYVAFAGKLYPVTKYGGSTRLMSAVLLGDTLYFTMRAGSGISYCELGKIWVSEAGLQILQSANYRSTTAPYLCLRESGAQIVVELGGLGSTFNSCTSLGVFGWLRDDGTKVVAVDATGAVIPYRFEGGW